MSIIPQYIQFPKQLVEKYQIFIFDMDGVLWQGENNFKSSFDYLQFLKQNKKKVYFITNNSTKDREFYLKKLESLGYQCNIDNIYTSGSIAAQFLQERKINKVFVIGMEGLLNEIRKKNIKTVHIQENKIISYEDKDNQQENFITNVQEIEIDDSIEALIQGNDMKIDYNKLAYAGQILKYNQNSLFLQTNPDRSINSSKGKLIPGAGCITQFLSYFSQKQPHYMFAKPNPYILQQIMHLNSFQSQNCIFIGDNLETDIQCANSIQIDSLLVLSGVTDINLLQSTLQSQLLPKYYAECLFI